MFLLILVAFLSNGFGTNAWARPEYALRLGMVSCMGCHASPAGGGPKNVNGKIFGTHTYAEGLFTRKEEVSGDIRLLVSYPNRPATTSSGSVVMAAVPGFNLTLFKNESMDTHLVAATSLGFLASGLREVFLQVRPTPEESTHWVDSILVGRFQVPFGLMTDEHRTYTRIQTKTTYNHFELGTLLSGTPSRFVHYDLGVTTGLQNGGASFSNSDLTYALIGNLRTDFQVVPVTLGLSGMVHQTSTYPYMPYAAAVSAGLSLERLLKLRFLRADLLAEVALGRGWNDSSTNSNISKFINATDTAFQNGIINSTSLGVTVLANYYLFEWLSLIYKFEELAFDYRYLGDAYYRHGFGVKYFVSSFFNVQARYELQWTGRPGITENDASFVRNTFYTVLNITF